VGVLKGEVGGSARAATVLNAGAAIWVAGMSKTLADGVRKAEAALDAGAGLDKLRALREASQGD
jgi:anthranilate phosphoribosyltransferase